MHSENISIGDIVIGKIYRYSLQTHSLLQVCVSVVPLSALKRVNKKGPRLSFLFLLVTCYMYVTVIVQFIAGADPGGAPGARAPP